MAQALPICPGPEACILDKSSDTSVNASLPPRLSLLGAFHTTDQGEDWRLLGPSEWWYWLGPAVGSTCGLWPCTASHVSGSAAGQPTPQYLSRKGESEATLTLWPLRGSVTLGTRSRGCPHSPSACRLGPDDTLTAAQHVGQTAPSPQQMTGPDVSQASGLGC